MEMTFALNHMSYFVLTQGLRERLIASAPARVIRTASDAHQSATLDFADLESEKAYAEKSDAAQRLWGESETLWAVSQAGGWDAW